MPKIYIVHCISTRSNWCFTKIYEQNQKRIGFEGLCMWWWLVRQNSSSFRNSTFDKYYPRKTIFFLFFSFLVLAIFSTFPYYKRSTLWMCKNQFLKLCLHCKHPRSGPAGLQGGSAALFAFSVDTCVRIQNVTVFSYLVFTLHKLRCRPLLGHWYSSLSVLNWFPSIIKLVRKSFVTCFLKRNGNRP